MTDEKLELKASALAAQAEAQIISELGPRSLPGRHMENYLATAEDIASKVFGPQWKFRVVMLVTGEPRVFPEQYVGSQIDRRPLSWMDQYDG